MATKSLYCGLRLIQDNPNHIIRTLQLFQMWYAPNVPSGNLNGYIWQKRGLRAQTHSEESLFFQTSVAIVVVFLAEMGRISCCGRPESSSSNIWYNKPLWYVKLCAWSHVKCVSLPALGLTHHKGLSQEGVTSVARWSKRCFKKYCKVNKRLGTKRTKKHSKCLFVRHNLWFVM